MSIGTAPTRLRPMPAAPSVLCVLPVGHGVALRLGAGEDLVVVAALATKDDDEQGREEAEKDEHTLAAAAAGRRTSKVLSPKKWIFLKLPVALTWRRQYVLSQPSGKTSKLICKKKQGRGVPWRQCGAGAAGETLGARCRRLPGRRWKT